MQYKMSTMNMDDLENVLNKLTEIETMAEPSGASMENLIEKIMGVLSDDVSERLEAYVAEKQYGPVQLSAEWHRRRRRTIGGSEQATLEGVNPYNSIQELMYSKVYSPPRAYSIKTSWGLLFEDIICKVAETKFNTEIKLKDAFIIGKIPEQSYSPDGIGIVEIGQQNYKMLDDFVVPTRGIALFEFKCPFNRQITKIPAYYIPQVRAGLATIPICDFGVYMEGMFRRCSRDQLNNATYYNRSLTPYDKRVDGAAESWGCIGFYIDFSNLKSADVLHQFLAALKNEGVRPVNYASAETNIPADLNDISDELFTEMLYLFSIHVLMPIYSNLETDDSWNNIVTTATANKHILIGIMPWKLLKTDVTLIKKNPDYMDKWFPKIQDMISVIAECQDQPEFAGHILANYHANILAEA